MSTIAFATCREKPELQPSDRLTATALAARGVDVRAVPWNGPISAYEGADAIVVRSTWDYLGQERAFLAWLNALEGRDRVFNPPRLMRWNLSKRYLARLAWAGAPVLPTRFTAPHGPDIAAAMDELGLDDAVVKPVFGLGGVGLSVVARDDAAGLNAAAAKLNASGMVQPVRREIAEIGETSIIFFGGEYSHAVNKKPAAGGLLVQEKHGGVTTRVEPEGAIIEAAKSILDLLPIAPLYARIDAIVDGLSFELMEAELIEPELFLHVAPEAAETFADAILAATLTGR
ncbi:MAG: hypothetical protein AAFX08_02645 [Pseudomonadota bacterium]